MRASLLLAFLVACDCGGGGGSGTPCDTTAECPSDEVCIDNRCQEPAAADSGTDGGRDAAGRDVGSRDTSGGFDTGGDANEDSSCGGEAIAIDYRPPNVLVVFDRSCSMRRTLTTGDFGTGPEDPATRWNTAREAVMSVIRSFETRVFWGLMAYPDPREGCGMGTDSEVAPGPGTADTIQSELMRTQIQPFGLCGPDNSDTTTQPRQTPTNDALVSAEALPELSDGSRPSFVLLVTDGGESCVGNDVLSATATRMRDAGIPVAVVGFATGASVDSLEAIAANGGLARPGGSPSYYVAEDSAELTTVFRDLTASFVSCDLPLSSSPPDGESLFVYVDDVEEPEDATDGWTYDMGTNTVTLNGDLCDRLRTGMVTRINVSFGCAPMMCTPQPEICNGLDEDCDDRIDEGCLL